MLLAGSPVSSLGSVKQGLADAGVELELDTVGGNHDMRTALGGNGYDCALIDIAMPAFDGAATIAALRDDGVDTPIVMITDGGDTGRSRELLDAGAADCLARGELTGERLCLSLLSAVRAHRALRQLSDSERELANRLLHDELTQLPNRALFFDRTERALALAQRENRPMAMLLLDLNQFSTINQSLGHGVGDRLLAEAGARLFKALRNSDSIARIGDDEFAALLPTGGNLTGAVTAASKLLDVINRPFLINDHRFTISCAVGIALSPLHGMTADKLLACAESAVRIAKRDAVGFAVYSGDDGQDHGRQLSLAHDLREAIKEQQQLLLHYQPKIDMRTGRICGAEALVRWQHPTQGLIYPDNFIPLAEQIGVIEGLTRWVLNAALQQTQVWHSLGLDLSVSVNLSALSLHNQELGDTVERLLTKWRVPPESLVLEITESAIIADVVRASETLNRLHRLGVRLSIDDFGTGYTSLAYLRKLPVSELKIDKSFVMNMRTVNDDSVIVRTIVELGRSLGLQVVAEGVEDAETWDALAALGCDIAQGYHMSRPVDPVAFARWLADAPWGLEAARTAQLA